jgi:hypothetical protein
LTDENIEWLNSIQYSIWDTSTDKNQLKRLRQALETHQDASLEKTSFRPQE